MGIGDEDKKYLKIRNTTLYSVKIFYRSINQSTYFQEDMSNLGGKYSYEIPETFIGNQGIEYFILLELSGYGMISYPEEDPFRNPIQVKVMNQTVSRLNQSTKLFEQSFGLEPDVQILSPNPDSKILAEDIDNVDLRVIPYTGHMIMIEQPDIIANELYKFTLRNLL